MGTLSGQSISNTYDGLLKLSDSTQGITPNLQPIEDGLGNNTGSRISTQGITSPNIVNVQNNLVPDFMGNGFSNTSSTPVANTQNRLIYSMFYDTGVHSYSAITYNLSTLSTTSDIVDFYIYSLQLVPGFGVAPKDLIMGGIRLESASPSTLGVKTTVLPSTLSFSGTGGGWYVYAYTVSNANVTPTVRYNNPAQQPIQYGIPTLPLGYYISVAGVTAVLGSRLAVFMNGTPVVINNLAVQPSYSVSDIQTNWAAIGTLPQIGFGLNVIR